MRSARLAAVLLLALARAARGELLVFDAGNDPPTGTIWSSDGYHYAYLESDEEGDRWIVDGRVRVRGEEGELTGPGALNADGSILLHSTGVLDKAGKLVGVSAAVNGRRFGAVHPEIRSFHLSRRGSNAAAVVRTAKGWAVSSAQGTGPSFDEPPIHISLTDTQTLYYALFGGHAWLYRDHKPVERKPYTEASASRDLRRTGGVFADSAGRVFVEVDKAVFGPYASATVPAFSANGRHSAFMAGTETQSSYDTLIVDGKPARMRKCSDCSVTVDDQGRAFQDVILTGITERAQIHAAFLDGASLHPGGQPPRVGLAPGGRHFVYPMMAPRGLAVGLDGKIAETGAPMPLVPAPCEFDGEEYHYWSVTGKKLYLVCGSAEGPRGSKARCEAVARGRGWPRVP